MPPKGPADLPRLLAYDNALNPTFGRAARAGGVGDDVLDVKVNRTVATPADNIPEVAQAHKEAWTAMDRQDFDGAERKFRKAGREAEKRGEVAYKSENTLALVYAAMADFDSALRQTSRMKMLVMDAPLEVKARFRIALHTNRGAIFSRRASREVDPHRRQRLFRLSYDEHARAAVLCHRYYGELDTERIWNVADAACRLGRFEEVAAHLSQHWRSNRDVANLLNTHSQNGLWPEFVSRYQEEDGQWIEAVAPGYRK